MSTADEAMIASQLVPLDYAVYGVLCAAKWETGPEGARRMWRIGLRLNAGDADIADSLRKLMRMGWVKQSDPLLGMRHYESVGITLAVSATEPGGAQRRGRPS